MKKKRRIIAGRRIRPAEQYSGFTSGLFWHFTGGPSTGVKEIHIREDFYRKRLKPTGEASRIMLKVLESGVLKATCEEYVFPIKDEDFKTDPFCCVTDIPFARLHLHGEYYGKVAIGFKSEPIYDDFYPIRYDNSHDDIYRSLYQSINGIKALRSKIEYPPTQRYINELIAEIRFNMSLCKRTTFDSDFNKSFYYEREWRCFEDFEFSPNDVGALLVPRTRVVGSKKPPFLEQVINSKVYKTGYRHVPVIPWEMIREL